jgi:hypothetical protein
MHQGALSDGRANAPEIGNRPLPDYQVCVTQTSREVLGNDCR